MFPTERTKAQTPPSGEQHPAKLPPHHFVRRLAYFVVLALALIAVALAIGVTGYHFIAGFGWVDSILNASMILGGMGPVGDLHGDAAKLFASAYAIFSGLVFVGVMGIILTPVTHRVLHKFHADVVEHERRTRHADAKPQPARPSQPSIPNKS